MKTNSILTLCLAGLLLTGSGISLTSCQGDDVDTNQFTGGISLNVFGPCPVARVRVRWHAEANSVSSVAEWTK